MASEPLCILCNLLPMQLRFDGMPICGSCNTNIIHQFIEYSQKRVPKKSQAIQIDEAIFIGDEDSARNPEDLKNMGIQNILIAGSYMQAWHENLFKYKQLQINDTLEENIVKHLDTALDFLMNTPGNTLVHCGAGVSRSGSIVVAYLMKKYNLSYDDALAKAREKSPKIRPNSSFERQLREWQKTHLPV